MPKTPRFNIGSSDFAETIERNYFFADHTLLIKDFFDSTAKVNVVTMPRRWGKTLNLSMLQYFFAHGKPTSELFKNLKIAHEHAAFVREHQGQYPVIFISFKDVKATNFQDFTIE